MSNDFYIFEKYFFECRMLEAWDTKTKKQENGCKILCTVQKTFIMILTVRTNSIYVLHTYNIQAADCTLETQAN